MSIAAVAAIVGAGASVYSSSKSGSGNAGAGTNTYIPSGQGTADQSFQDMLQQLMQSIQQTGGQITPELQQAFQKMLGIPTEGLTGAADKAGAMYGDLAGTALQDASTLRGQAATGMGAEKDLLGAGKNLYETSLDPQNALRDKLQKQVTDASRAGTSARGIGMGAEAAGIENQDVQNFLLNWQNQQLQRQATGVQGMAGAANAAGNQANQVGRDVIGAQAVGSAAPGYATAAGSVPYGAATTAAQQPFNAANAFSGATAQGVQDPMNAFLKQIIPYLYQGTGATGQAFGQKQDSLAGLTKGLGTLGTIDWSKLGSLFNTGQGYGTAGSSDASAGGTYASGPW